MPSPGDFFKFLEIYNSQMTFFLTKSRVVFLMIISLYAAPSDQTFHNQFQLRIATVTMSRQSMDCDTWFK